MEQEFIVIVFEGRYTADDALSRLRRMEENWEVDLDEIVLMTRDKDGVTWTEADDRMADEGFLVSTSLGALAGTIIGTIAGNPLAGFLTGSALGAGSGALVGSLSQADDEDSFAELVESHLTPGSSALGLIGWADRPERVLEALSGFKGKVLESTLSFRAEKKLGQALAS